MQLWLIPILPFLGFAINGLMGKKLPKPIINAVAVGSVLLSFLWVLKTLNALGAFSGGLDTSFCVPYLQERGWRVHTVFADTGGVDADERGIIEARAAEPLSGEGPRLARRLRLSRLAGVGDWAGLSAGR